MFIFIEISSPYAGNFCYKATKMKLFYSDVTGCWTLLNKKIRNALLLKFEMDGYLMFLVLHDWW